MPLVAATSSRALLALLLAAAAGCADIEPEPPLDEEGEPIAMPQAYDSFLVVTDVDPGGEQPLAPRPRITLTFSDYLDDDSFLPFALVSLTSGGLRAQGLVYYRMAYRQLVFEPFAPLATGLRYRLALETGALTSATGAPYLPTEAAEQVWIVEDGAEAPELSEEPDAGWEAVRALFRQRCDGCHGDPQWQLVPLTHQALLQKSKQVDRYLVRPFDPADSYLMHKILPGYADRRFTAQPPPWHESSQPLGLDEIWLVERWIRDGARGPDAGLF